MATSIARYLLDEASTGTTPTTVVDGTGNGNGLTITYSGDATWTSVGAGNGLDYTATPITTNSAKAELTDVANNGTIGSSLASVTECSFLAVVDVDAGSSSGARIFQIGTSTGNGELALVEDAFETVVRIGGSTAATFAPLAGLGVTVVACVIDTTEALAADRVKVWYDGVAKTPNTSPVSLNATIDANNSSFSMCLGNRPSANRNFDGKFYYFELFSDKLTSGEVTDSNTNLSADNDAAALVADVTAPVISSPTGTTVNDISATGTVSTDEGNGLLYYYASTSSSETAVTIKASGSSQAVSASGAQAVTFTGLTQSTTYYAHYVQEDSATNQSNVVSSASFTTLVTQATVSNIDTDDDVQAGQAGVTIAGTNFGTVTGVTLGGEALVLNSNTATEVDVDIPSTINLRWGVTTYELAVTNTVGTGTLSDVTLSAQAGWEVANYDGPAPDPATTESFYEEAQSDSDVGNLLMGLNDLLAWESQSGLTVDAQTIPIVAPPATVAGDYRLWDDSVGSWTGTSTFTIIDGSFADTVPPVLSSPTGAETSDTTASGSVSTDEGNGVLYYYASTNSSESAATIKASGLSVGVSATGAKVVGYVGLTAATTYYAHYVQDDSSSNESNVVSSGGFTTQTTPDVTAPVLTSPTATTTSPVSATGTVVTDESGGVLYFLPSSNSSETAATIKAGGLSQSVLVTGEQTVGLADITPETTYYLHYVQDDASSNESNVVSSGSFTTPAGNVIPLDSRQSIGKLADHLRSTGSYSHTQTNEIVWEWLVGLGVPKTQLNQMLYQYLGSIGYVGTLPDRVYKWGKG